jgi:hypothetical protein
MIESDFCDILKKHIHIHYYCCYYIHAGKSGRDKVYKLIGSSSRLDHVVFSSCKAFYWNSRAALVVSVAI